MEPQAETKPSALPVAAFYGLLLLVLGILSVLWFQWVSSARNRSNTGAYTEQDAVRQYKMVEEFRLTNQHGQEFGSQELAGKVWIADFVFTSCAAECPILSTRMAELQKRFSGQPDVAFVSISVDPNTDTPERLADYAGRFNAGPGWNFLTGPPRQVNRLIKGSFLLPVAESDGERNDILMANLIHTEKIAVVDRMGVVRFYTEGLPANSVDEIEDAVRSLLQENAELPPS